LLEGVRTKKGWEEEFRLRSLPAEFENKAIIARLRKPETVLLGLDFTTESIVTLEALGDLLLFFSPH